MKLYIIRHGETDWNAGKRLQGRTDIELNSEGKRLAKITSDALADVPFTRIYTSPLKRAYETALLIKRDRDIPIIKEERIIEISFGEYEGLSYSKDNYTVKDLQFMNFFENPKEYNPPKDAESIDELCARTSDFLEKLVHNKNMEDEVILISTHGAALRGILSGIYGIGREEFWNGGVHRNCAVTIVDVQNGITSVLEEGKIYYDTK